MKGYRKIVPIALVVLFVVSIFMTMKNNINTEKQYDTYISNAREAASYEIYVDAEADYTEALNMQKSINIYNELIETYIADDKENEARQTAESMVDDFPYDVQAYVICAELYQRYESYDDIYDLYNKYQKKELYDEKMEQIYDDVEWLYEAGSSFENVGVYSNGLCAAVSGDKWGYINTAGKKTIDFKYKSVTPFINDIAAVETESGDWYFIDMEGNKKKVLNKIEDVKAIGITADAIPVYDGSKWSYYTNNQKLICGGYDEAATMANGYAAVCEGGSWYMINSDGEKVSDQAYDEIAVDEKGIAYRQVYFARTDKEWHMYSSDGKMIGDASYEDVRLFNSGGELAAVKYNGKWGFIKADGSVAIEPQYEDARSFANGVAAVKKDDAWGYIDENNDMVMNNQYADAKDMTDSGTTIVSDSGNWQILKLRRYQ